MPSGYKKNGEKIIPPSRKGIKLTKETKNKISLAHKGKKPYKMTDEIRKNMSKAHKGKIPWNKGKKDWMIGTKAGFQKGHKDFVLKKSRKIAGKKISLALKGRFVGGGFKKGHPEYRTKEGIEIMRKKISGNKNWNWKGGISSENDKARNNIEINLWKRSVFERDNFQCQKCDKIGVLLNAHHIKNFSKFIELRTSIENGITFCEKCHRKFHKIYGIKNNSLKQVKEFIE